MNLSTLDSSIFLYIVGREHKECEDFASQHVPARPATLLLYIPTLSIRHKAVVILITVGTAVETLYGNRLQYFFSYKVVTESLSSLLFHRLLCDLGSLL